RVRQPRRARVLQDAHARGGLAVRRRGVRALLLPRLLLRGLGHDPGAVDPRTAVSRAAQALAAARPLSRALLHLGRDPLAGRRPARQDRGDRAALRRRAPEPPRRDLDRLRRLALQRAPLKHRAPASPEPRVAGVTAPHGGPPRRGARADTRMSQQEDRASAQRRQAELEHAERALQRAAEAGIHRLAIPTPFQVGRVNAYLIEDEPLTLVDSGPNSAKAVNELEQALAALGYAVEDLELLVISHQHMDHFGLASILARRSGAEVAALHVLAPY